MIKFKNEAGETVDKGLIKLYFYNGFNKPKLININDVEVNHNYLGDITTDLIEEYNSMIKNYSIDEIEQNQFLSSNYNIWINPTKEMLGKYNKSIMLNKNDYLRDFENDCINKEG